MIRTDTNEIKINRIVFSDESTIMLNDAVNKHNKLSFLKQQRPSLDVRKPYSTTTKGQHLDGLSRRSNTGTIFHKWESKLTNISQYPTK